MTYCEFNPASPRRDRREFRRAHTVLRLLRFSAPNTAPLIVPFLLLLTLGGCGGRRSTGEFPPEMSEEERTASVQLLECATAYARQHPLPVEVAEKLGARAGFAVVDSIVAIGSRRCSDKEGLDAPPDGGPCGDSRQLITVYVRFDGEVEPLRTAGLEGGDPIADVASGRIEVRRLCELARVPGVRHIDVVPEVIPNVSGRQSPLHPSLLAQWAPSQVGPHGE